MNQHEFAIYLGRLKQSWKEGGGFEGARARLKFAEDFLEKSKNRRAKQNDRRSDQENSKAAAEG